MFTGSGTYQSSVGPITAGAYQSSVGPITAGAPKPTSAPKPASDSQSQKFDIWKPTISGALYIPADFAVHKVMKRPTPKIFSIDTLISALKQVVASAGGDMSFQTILGWIPEGTIKQWLVNIIRPVITGTLHEVIDYFVKGDKNWKEMLFDGAESGIVDQAAIMIRDSFK